MSKHKLLLADDSVTIQKVVNLTFADEGIEVITVGDGNSAMEKFVEATPDLVMVDVNMPGVDGYRICEIIKQDDNTKHIPVILLVGSFEPFDEEEARRVGANDYLTKPFQSIRQLVNKVTVLLNKSNGNEASVQPKPENPSAEIPVQKQIEEVSEPLGDPGMDDEMIQANQIGSLPVDDIQKLESAINDFEGNLPQRQLQNPSEEFSIRKDFEVVEDFGKTQSLSAEEFDEMTMPPVMKIAEPELPSPNFANERISAEEKALSLEKQMVSEFESETKQMTSEFELQANESSENLPEMPAPQPVFQEEIFTPEEIPVENQIKLEEISSEKGFVIEEIETINNFAPKESTVQIPSIEESETILEELYDAPEDFNVGENIQQNYYHEPDTAKAEEIAAPQNFNEQIDFSTARTDTNQIFGEPETPAEIPFETPQTSGLKQEFEDQEMNENKSSVQSEIVETPSFESFPKSVEDVQKVPEQPNFVQLEEPPQLPAIEQSLPQTPQFIEPLKTYPVDQYFDNRPSIGESENDIETPQVSDFISADTAAEIEPEFKYAEREEEIEPSYTEPSYTEKIAEPQQNFVSEAQVSQYQQPFVSEIAEIKPPIVPEVAEIQQTVEPPQFFVEEVATPTVEIPAPFPTVEEEIPAIEEEEQPLEIEPQTEKRYSEVDSVVSKKEQSEAVESVIVSEFARHSISLSSEAVEKIAARIAEKISEKIIQQLANDVVGSLADLIVEKMERKKLG